MRGAVGTRSQPPDGALIRRRARRYDQHVPRRSLATLLLVPFAAVAFAGLTAEQQRGLESATYVYVQSERKSGDWSKPAEIWFFVDGGTVYVGTRPTSWRVRRIKAGRTRARVAIGTPNGPAFEATAALVRDPRLEERLMESFARKYPDGWAKHERSFRDGFRSGDRVLVAYTPR